LGGGNGFMTRRLLDAGFDAVLVEPGESGARNAAQRNVTVICATLATAKFRKDSLPAAAIFDVLEHIEDDIAFLRELHRCLQPGARLYVTVPSYSWLWSDDDVVAGHWRRHTLGSLCSRLSATGFRTLYRTYLFSPLPLPILALRSLPSLFGRRRLSRQRYGSLHQQRAGFVANRVWDWEKRVIERGGTIPFGSSCVLVAQKS
jgi:SAM-dependent methyltransferase